MGNYVADRIRKKIKICEDLIKLCDLVSTDMAYKQSPIISLVLESVQNTNIDFITSDCFYHCTVPQSCLADHENQRIGEFIFSLGKTDTASQLNMIDAFRKYISMARDNYSAAYSTKSKVYIAFGLCCGLALSLLLI